MWEGDHFLKYLVLNDGQIYFEMLCVQTDTLLDVMWWCNQLQTYLHEIGASVPMQATIPLSLRAASFRIAIKGSVQGPTPFRLDNFYAFIKKADNGRSQEMEKNLQSLNLNKKCETDLRSKQESEEK